MRLVVVRFLRMSLSILGVFLLTLSIIASSNAGDKKSDEKKMSMEKHTYLILARHTPEECLKLLDNYATEKPDLLQKMEWGCKVGDHTGYLIVEANNEQEVRNMVPADQQKSVQIEELNKFTAQQIKDIHKKM